MITPFEKSIESALVIARVAKDKKLTIRALGLLVKLLTREDDGRTDIKKICRDYTDGGGAFSELTESGYVERNGNGEWVLVNCGGQNGR